MENEFRKIDTEAMSFFGKNVVDIGFASELWREKKMSGKHIQIYPNCSYYYPSILSSTNPRFEHSMVLRFRLLVCKYFENVKNFRTPSTHDNTLLHIPRHFLWLLTQLLKLDHHPMDRSLHFTCRCTLQIHEWSTSTKK